MQSRNADALQVKIDELVRATKGVRLALLNLEKMRMNDLDRIKQGVIDLGRCDRGGGDDLSQSAVEA